MGGGGKGGSAVPHCGGGPQQAYTFLAAVELGSQGGLAARLWGCGGRRGWRSGVGAA